MSCGCSKQRSKNYEKLWGQIDAAHKVLREIMNNNGIGCDSPNWMSSEILEGFDDAWECGYCNPCIAKKFLYDKGVK